MYDIVDGITDAGLTHLIGMKSLTRLERKSRPNKPTPPLPPSRKRARM
jgi:hypothetical protein